MGDILWLAEFLLELTGAFFALRRRSFPLFAYLAFSAFSDIGLYSLQNVHPLFGYLIWASDAIGYLLLGVLACQLVAYMVADRKPLGPPTIILLSMGIGIVSAAFQHGETLADRLQDAEIVAGACLTLVLAVAWGTRKRFLDRQRMGMLVGLIAKVTGDLTGAALMGHWKFWGYVYPVAGVIALLIWNWAITLDLITQPVSCAEPN